jgi:hypothetical protein
MPSRQSLKRTLPSIIAKDRKAIASYQETKKYYGLFIKVYDFLAGKALDRVAGFVKFPLEGAKEGVDEAANQLFFRLDRDIALTKRALAADQSLLAAINRGQKNVCGPWVAWVHALDDTKALPAEKANAYSGFLHGYKLVRRWLTDNTSLKKYPWVKKAVEKHLDPWMEDVLKQLQRQATP